MKKFIILLLISFISFGANALEIKELGFKSNDIKDFKIYTRNNYENISFLQENDIFAIAEDDNYTFYIRAINNPGIANYEKEKDLVDEVFALINKVNTSEYSYIAHKDYKWIRFDYVDKNKRPILEYFISWKDIYVTISLIGKGEEIPYETKVRVDKFVESIDLNGKGKIPVNNIYKQGVDLFSDKKENKDHSIIVLIMLCLCSIGISWYLTRKKN